MTSGEVVHHSRDLFGPGGMDLHVVRGLDVERPAQVNPAAENGPRGARGARPGAQRRGLTRRGRSQSGLSVRRTGHEALTRACGRLRAGAGAGGARAVRRHDRRALDDEERPSREDREYGQTIFTRPPVKVPKLLACKRERDGTARPAPSTCALEPRVAERAARVEPPGQRARSPAGARRAARCPPPRRGTACPSAGARRTARAPPRRRRARAPRPPARGFQVKWIADGVLPVLRAHPQRVGGDRADLGDLQQRARPRRPGRAAPRSPSTACARGTMVLGLDLVAGARREAHAEVRQAVRPAARARRAGACS